MIEEFQSGVAGEFLRFHQEEPLTGCGRKDLIEKMLSRGKFGFPSAGFIILDRSASGKKGLNTADLINPDRGGRIESENVRGIRQIGRQGGDVGVHGWLYFSS